jgi:hypothetical protein
VTTASLPSGAGLGSGFSAPGAVPAIGLPVALAPLDETRERRFTEYWPDVGPVSGTREDLRAFRKPLKPRPGTPLQVVRNCREAIVAAALPYGVVRVDAASAGAMQSGRSGYMAPVEFRVVYARKGGLETRQAVVGCRLDTAGRVYAAA